jgi:hypothetical protein
MSEHRTLDDIGNPYPEELGSQDRQGCQHWGLSNLQLRQEKLARTLRKNVLFSGKGLDAIAEEIRAEIGEEGLQIVLRIGNSNGKTALHMAAWRGDASLVEGLLDLGAAIDAVTIRGQSALHFAAGKRRAQVVDILLMRGARVRIRTVWGETPVGLAVQLGASEETISTLIAAEERDTRNWICFETEIRSRPARRAVMGRLGTLIFSGASAEDEAAEDDAHWPDNSPHPHSGATPDNSPGKRFRVLTSRCGTLSRAIEQGHRGLRGSLSVEEALLCRDHTDVVAPDAPGHADGAGGAACAAAPGGARAIGLRASYLYSGRVQAPGTRDHAVVFCRGLVGRRAGNRVFGWW